MVHYLNTATDQQGLSSFSRTSGYETVEERPFCMEHARSVSALVVAEVDKRFTYVSADPSKFSQRNFVVTDY